MKTEIQVYDDQRQHVLDRPDTYIGSNKTNSATMYLVTDTGSIEPTVIDFNAGLERLYIEVLCNAHDNIIRSMKTSTPMRELTIQVTDMQIMIYNDGQGISHKEVVSKETGKIVKGSIGPDIVFGRLLSGTNFNDTIVKNTSGRNGYGAKLSNIFSKFFHVESFDEVLQQLCICTWYDNMSRKDDITIKKQKGKTGWTRVTFEPDFKRFHSEGFSKEMLSYFRKLAIDIAMQRPTVKVSFNGDVLKIKSLKDYAHLYVGKKAPLMEFQTINSQVIVVDCSPKISKGEEEEENPSEEKEEEDDDFEEIRTKMQGKAISFVNGICCSDGGVHVDDWIRAIGDPLIEKLSQALKIIKLPRNKEKKPDKKKKVKTGFKLTIRDIKDHLAFFIICNLDDPSFDSQTKLRLNAPHPKTCEPTTSQLSKMIKWPIKEHMAWMLRSKTLMKQGETDATTTGYLKVPKHIKANWYRRPNYKAKTRLILAEGDSAVSTANKTISSLPNGKDIYGTFPLRGKIINTRNAKVEQINNNREISFLKQIIGLKHGVDYSDDANFARLNYGQVQLWTDQDLDGDHIKGLIINWFEENWPSLIKRGYITVMNTPIVLAWVGKGKKGEIHQFYELGRFHEWYKDQDTKNIKVKYFKGLGTWGGNNEQAIALRDVITSYEDMKITKYTADNEEDSEAVKLAFMRTRADDRKRWIMAYKNDPIDPSEHKELSLHDFINRCLRAFSVETLRRAIPSIMDGLKEGQRKILYVVRKQNIREPVKLLQLGGRIMEYGAYHHGDQALYQTIVYMAQGWVGRNVVPLMLEEGEFGSRFAGHGAYAQARYIGSGLSPIADTLFIKDDDDLLRYRMDDGMIIEPETFMPCMPVALMNIVDGIATGWNTRVPSYNPSDIADWIKAYIKGNVSADNLLLPKGQMVPWYFNFKGTVVLDPPAENALLSTGYTVSGVYNVIDNKVRITELPPGIIPMKYIEFLSKLEENKVIKEYTNYCGETTIDFTLYCNDKIPTEKTLRMIKHHSFSCMVLLDEKGLPKRYKCAEEILAHWCRLRRQLYDLRKRYMLQQYKLSILYINNRIRFIEEIIVGTFVINNKGKKIIESELKAKKYDTKNESYDYLLSMTLYALTKEKLEDLHAELKREKTKYTDLKNTSPDDLWIREIDAFLKKYEKYAEDYRNYQQKIQERIENVGGINAYLKAKKKTKK